MSERREKKPGIGKLETSILADLIKKYSILDPQIVIGPDIGEDAAVIDLGPGVDDLWVVTTDPITFTTEEIGYYGVVVNLNDIATRGAIPKWFMATLLFPEGTRLQSIEEVFRQIHEACRRFGISFIGGHTEITSGIEKLILSGQMIGLVKKDRLVTTRGAKAGDIVILVKGVCIEGTSIMAREKESELLSMGIAPSLIQRAKAFISDPGIEVLRAARIACDHATVHSMHDPTEGGLINGIVEMALASKKEIEIDLNKVPVYEESRILCEQFGLNPLGVIASGALLLSISPSDHPAIQQAYQEASIPIQVIGQVREGVPRVLARDGNQVKELEPFTRDEILKIF